MIRQLLLFVGDPVIASIRIVWRFPGAVEALERPVVVPAARRYRIAAFCCLAVTGLLAVPAAIIHTMFGECPAFNMCGFGALITLGMCILSGVRYGELNLPEAVTSEFPTTGA